MRQMRQMKRALAIVLLLALILGCLVFPVFAAEIVASGYCGGEGDGKNLTWTLDSEGTLIISGTGKMVTGEIRDPDEGGDAPLFMVDDKSSTLFASSVMQLWQEYYSDIKKVIVEDGVTTIREQAFASCNNLTEVIIGSGVTEIGFSAFQNRAGQTDIYFRGNAPIVGETAFVAATATLYYTPGTTGWTDSEAYDATAGTWNGYQLAAWQRTSFSDAPAVKSVKVTGNDLECTFLPEVFRNPEAPAFTQIMIGAYDGSGKFLAAAMGNYDGGSNTVIVTFAKALPAGCTLKAFCVDDNFAPKYKVSEF